MVLSADVLLRHNTRVIVIMSQIVTPRVDVCYVTELASHIAVEVN